MHLLLDADLQIDLKRVVVYDQDTGHFTRLVTTSSRAVKGTRAGGKSGHYRSMCFKGKYYLEHQLVFLYMLGYIPKMVDHINRDKLDNRWGNLREACAQTNQYNKCKNKGNTSGCTGVYWSHVKKRWHVRFRVNKKDKWFGAYKDFELAELVAFEARDKYHGSFAGEL